MLHPPNFDQYKQPPTSSKSKTMEYIIEIFPQRVANVQARLLNEEEPNEIQGEGMETIIPSDIYDRWTGLKVLLGLKLSGHADILTEANFLRDDL